MPVNGVGSTGSERVEQVKAERRATEARAEKSESRSEAGRAEERRTPETGRGENMDVSA